MEVLGGDCHVSVESPTDQLKHIHPSLSQVIYPEMWRAMGHKGHIPPVKYANDEFRNSMFLPLMKKALMV